MLLARRSLWQTLLAGVGCGGILGLLPGRLRTDPGKYSPRLGIPGLNDAAPLVLEWWGGGVVEWWSGGVVTRWKRKVFQQGYAECLASRTVDTCLN